MKKLALLITALLMLSTTVFGETWIGICGDTQVNINVDYETAILYMKNTQIAEGKLTWHVGNSVGARFTEHYAANAMPMSEIRMDKKLKTMSILWRSPVTAGVETTTPLCNNAYVRVIQ